MSRFFCRHGRRACHAQRRCSLYSWSASSAIASGSNTAGTYIYVTDSTNGNVLGYAVSSSVSTAGFLTPLGGSPYPAGNQPSAIAVDPNYPFAYVTNSLDGNVEAYGSLRPELWQRGSSSTPVTYTSGIQPSPSASILGPALCLAVNFLGNGANGSIADF